MAAEGWSRRNIARRDLWQSEIQPYTFSTPATAISKNLSPQG
jgi:hypothetical protein